MTIPTTDMVENQGSPHVLYNANMALMKARQEKLVVNEQSGTAYELVLADEGKLVLMNNAGAMTLTVPTNASAPFEVGNVVQVCRYGSGDLDVVGDTGVTVHSAGSITSVADQYGIVLLIKLATNTWLMVGGLG